MCVLGFIIGFLTLEATSIASLLSENTGQYSLGVSAANPHACSAISYISFIMGNTSVVTADANDVIYSI